MQDLLVKGLNSKPKLDQLKTRLLKALTSEEARGLGLLLLEKTIELSIKALVEP